MEEVLKLALKEGSPWVGLLLVAFAIWKAAPKLEHWFDRWITHTIESGKRRDDAVVAINDRVADVLNSVEDARHAVISTIKEFAGEDKHAWRNKITDVVQGSFERQVAESEGRILEGQHDSEDRIIAAIRNRGGSGS